MPSTRGSHSCATGSGTDPSDDSWVTTNMIPVFRWQLKPMNTLDARSDPESARVVVSALRERDARWPLVLAILLGATYLSIRLAKLGALPMVSDEGTYIDWGVRAWHARDLSDWLASLEDGKQPLLAWLMIPFLSAVEDRLIAGRLTSIACGAINVALIWSVASRLGQPWGQRTSRLAGPIAGALYVITPVAVVHDRMALYDTLVTTASLTVLLTTIHWSERPGWVRMILVGCAIAVSVLTKLSALFFVGLVPVVAVAWNPASRRQWWQLAQAAFIGAGAYSVLYLSPIVDNLADGNFGRYSLTLREVMRFPLTLWWANTVFVAETFETYVGLPLILATVAAVLVLFSPAEPVAGNMSSVASNRGRSAFILAVWIVVPVAAFVLTAKLIYSRYVVFVLISTLIPTAIGAARAVVHLRGFRLETVKPNWAHHLANLLPMAIISLWMGAITISCTAFIWPLINSPAEAPWMNDRRYITDRFQYIESNYAGYGLAELLAFLDKARLDNPETGIVVITRTATGMPRDAIFAYLRERPGITLGYVDEARAVADRLSADPDRASFQAGRGAPIYYALTDAPGGEQERRFISLNPAARQLIDLPKPGDHSRFKLFQINWTPPAPDTVFDGTTPLLDAAIRLEGFRLDTPKVRAGADARVILYWTTNQRHTKDLTVFAHLISGVNPTGGLRVAQRDSRPGNGAQPTTGWRVGDFIADRYDINVPSGTPTGTYRLVVGMYDLGTMERMAVTAANGQGLGWPTDGTKPQSGVIDGENRVYLGEVTVE